MNKGIVFKQWYKPANLPSTAVLNVKHLEYIATRKGAIRNPGCGFGLWGLLPGQTGGAGNINSLTNAKAIVREASKAHTVYRTVFSLDDETAASKGYYARKPWQDLITTQIGVLAKEMDIAPKDFCWAASMHYSKGHPHVHVIYWDNSSKIRQEVVPKERFEILAEHVRAAFDRELFQEEIQKARTEAKETISAARTELTALCREANVAQALNLNNVSAAKLDEVGEALVDLMLALPQKGSLKSQFQNGAFGEKLDAFLDQIMTIRDFRAQETKYVKLSQEISAFYGNLEEKQAFQGEAARKQFRTDLKNSVLSMIRETIKELEADTPGAQRTDTPGVPRTDTPGAPRTDTPGAPQTNTPSVPQADSPDALGELRRLVGDGVRRLVLHNPHYAELFQMFPKLRTPISELRKDARFMEAKGRLVGELCHDIRIQSKVRGYINAQLKSRCPEGGKEGARAELTKEVYKKLYQTVDRAVLEKLEEDAGYRDQQRADLALGFLIRLFARCSQGNGQRRSQRDLLSLRKSERSKTAQKDLRKQMAQEGGWNLGN